MTGQSQNVVNGNNVSKITLMKLETQPGKSKKDGKNA
jgi:hypothetical protein